MTEQGRTPRQTRTTSSSRGRGGIRIVTLLGVPVYVTPSWLLIAVIITVLYQPMVERALHLGPASYLVALAFAVLLYVSVLIHELAHCVAARSFGLPVRRITLYMLGGVSEIEREAQTPGREFWVAFSGPLLSAVLAGGGFVVYLLVDPATVVGVLVWQLWVANLLVTVFNLLPGLPLDGGRILRAGVWAVTRRPHSGTVAAAWVGRGLGALIIALPFVYAVWLGVAPSLFGMLWSVLLGAFIWMGASSSLRNAQLRQRIPAIRARLLARRAVLVIGDTPLAEALRQRAVADAGAIIVTDSLGTPTSLVSDTAVSAVPEPRRPWLPVANTARAIVPEIVLSADSSGEELLRAMHDYPSAEYLLVEADGSPYGVLIAADVNRAFAAAG
ncbi:site-2 protease family protein [Nocardiopsis ansamitocini]|uniref:Zinc metalloprotease n=1 Tax=Nocardiopsis ansamitocini TaxID=1670832 RepID=A0A9W6P8B5_9ACTN|nr:site-2 protease family protein [Nocardiopsis ansamitocini]GLU48861.1 peptidase M50 [Nocardiopsis ansamitocini]